MIASSLNLGQGGGFPKIGVLCIPYTNSESTDITGLHTLLTRKNVANTVCYLHNLNIVVKQNL
jgi:hypothetical protein